MNAALWSERYMEPDDQIEDVPAWTRDVACLMAGGWFARCDDGPFSVWSVGEAGVMREVLKGIHYPYLAIARSDELQARTLLNELYFAQNNDDPEQNVERQNEAYYA